MPIHAGEQTGPCVAAKVETDHNAQYAFEKGLHEFEAWGAAAVSVTTLGGLDSEEVEGRGLRLIGFRYARVLLLKDSFALQYFADPIPLALQFNSVVSDDAAPTGTTRSAVYGAGRTPLGAKLTLRPSERIKPFVSLSGGFIHFTTAVPLPDAAKFNFTADVEVGAQFWLTGRQSFVGGIRFHHLSNAGLGEVNPSLNAFALYVDFSILE